MLHHLYSTMMDLYPMAFQSTVDEAMATVAHGLVSETDNSYEVTVMRRMDEDAAYAPETFVVQVDAHGDLKCACDEQARRFGPAEEDVDAEGACVHVVAVSVFLEDRKGTPRTGRMTQEPHSVTLGGFTPHGFTFLACLRGDDFASYDAMVDKLFTDDALFAQRGALPSERYRPGMATATPEAVKAASKPPTPETSPSQTQPGPVAQSQVQTPPVSPPAAQQPPPPLQPPPAQPAPAAQGTRGYNQGRSGGGRGYGGQGGQRTPPQPDGCFRATELIRTNKKSGGYYWAVTGKMPQNYRRDRMAIFAEGFANSGIQEPDINQGVGLNLTGFLAWYINDDQGLPSKVIKLEREAA